MNDTRFDQDLRTVLRDMAPAEVPDTLRFAVTNAARTLPAPRRGFGAARMPFAVVGLAAALVIAVAGIALLAGGRLDGIVGTGQPTPSPSPTPTVTSFTTIGYRLMPVDGRDVPPAAISTVADIMVARLRAMGIAWSTMESGGDAADVMVTVPTSDLERVRGVLGATGQLDVVPLGQTQVTEGQRIDLATFPPLFSGDQVASVAIGSDQTGQRTLDLTLTAKGRDLFAAWTAAHVGDYVALVLDGMVISAPVIRDSIPDGKVQISQGGAGGYGLQAAQDLVALLASRDLPYLRAYPYPVQEVSAAPASAPPQPVGTDTPAATALPTPGPTATPSASTLTWTGLDVSTVAGAPMGIEAVIPWTGGYLAIALTGWTERAWTSPDGRSWTALPADALGLGGLTGAPHFVNGTGCGDRLLVLTGFGVAQTLWSSSDGTTWASMPFGSGPGELAGGAGGAIMPTGSGTDLRVTSDCVNWRTVSLPGPSDATVTAVAATGGVFVAVGYTGSSGSLTIEPLAWRSADGITWEAATITAQAGDGLVSVAAGSEGFVATSTQPGRTPGSIALWLSPDARTWTRVTDGPLGVIASGEGVGSIAGMYIGDGTRLLAFGTHGGVSGPTEYWVSAGASWWKLALTGSEAAGLAADDGARPFLLRDGILFSGTGTTWLGTAVGH